MLNARHPVVLYNNGGWGDHLLNLPTLTALESLFPGRLKLICRRGFGAIVFSGLRLNRLCEAQTYPVNGLETFDNVPELATCVGECDLFISLNTWYSGQVEELLGLLEPKHSIGFDAPIFTYRLRNEFGRHAAELPFDAVGQLAPGLKLEPFAELRLAEEHHQAARRLRGSIPCGMNMLVVHADTDAKKMWPAQRFVRVLDGFLDRHREFVALVVGARDIGLDHGRHGDRVIPCFGLALPLSMALVAEADLFLGVDSCMLHAADLARVPGVGLFGPTHWHEWGFRFGPHRHVGGKGTMEAISEGAVLEELEFLWNTIATTHRLAGQKGLIS